MAAMVAKSVKLWDCDVLIRHAMMWGETATYTRMSGLKMEVEQLILLRSCKLLDLAPCHAP